MQGDNYATLTSELKHDEGVERVPYKDTKGNDTVAVGHNLECSPLPNAAYPLTDAAIDAILYDDLAETFAELDAHLPWWRDLSDVRQRVIANMCFNLGITRLLEFVKALTAARQGDYATSAAQMLASAWAGQVGNRAKRLAYMMQNNAVAQGVSFA